MEALARIGVFEQMRAVEIREAVLVGRKMRRYPIEDHADAVLVQHVDEVHEILRRAVAARRREKSRALVAPRAIERMLHDRQELDVREIHLAHVLGERAGDLAIAEWAIVVVGIAPPRA